MAGASKLPAHSPLGASGASRWLACPGSPSLCEEAETEESSFAAREGTVAHDVAERALREDRDTWEFVGEINDDIKVTAEMAVATDLFVRSIREEHPHLANDNHFIEQKFHCPEIHELFYGTADFVYLDAETGTVHIWDYKHGIGVVVEATDNNQLKYYAAGVLEELGLWKARSFGNYTRIVLHLVQPRAFHKDGPIRVWETTRRELSRWVSDVLVPGMDRAQDSDELNPGDHCRFCQARGMCPALDEVQEKTEALSAELDEAKPHEITHEKIGAFLDGFKLMKMRAKRLESQAFHRLNTGRVKIPGFKLVEGDAHRKWKDEAAAKKALVAEYGDKAFVPRKLKSPAQIEEMPKGKSFTTRFAHKPKGSLTVVESSDPRPEVSKDTKSGFETVKRKRRK